MKNEQNKEINIKGFTLIELLVVVMIIGILSAVALPMYRQAVEKSRVTDALNTMQAVAKSEHGWYLTNNSYTKNFANLDIELVDENGEKADGATYDTVNYTFTLQDDSIKAERANGEYTLYKMYEDPNIYCLPREHEICQQFGWGVNRQLCESIDGAWSNIKGQCYNSEQERCAATSNLDDEISSSWQNINLSYAHLGAYCGFWQVNGVKVEEFQACQAFYHNNCKNSTFTGEGSQCIAFGTGGGSTTANVCKNSEFNQGAECLSGGENQCTYNIFTTNSTCYSARNESCSYSTFTSGSKCIAGQTGWTCKTVTLSDGGVCISSEQYGGCRAPTVKAGGKCIANNVDSCISEYGTAGGSPSTYEPGSYCVGNAENSCKGFKNFKATCVANAPGACAGNTYSGDGCCSGQYCPEDAKKCS